MRREREVEADDEEGKVTTNNNEEGEAGVKDDEGEAANGEAVNDDEGEVADVRTEAKCVDIGWGVAGVNMSFWGDWGVDGMRQ